MSPTRTLCCSLVVGVVVAGLAPACATRRAPLVEHAAAQEPAPAQAASAAGFAGTWESTYGVLRLVQEGARVRGRYSYGNGSTVEGAVEGGVLRGTYEEPGGVRGRLVFALDDGGGSFRGRWRPEPERALELDDEDAHDWSGTRVVPVPGRTWLVILEAHWEGSLGEHEYSYGAMLREFFERVPSVEVRHRFVHDRADLARFCGELAALVEPVVLYVSSHGTEEGVVLGDGVASGAVLGAALRDAGELKRLHHGACAVMRGDAPRAIRAAAAPHAPFPISGFKVPVDWAGSAIVDFAYLALVLEQGMAPAEAVAKTRAMLSAARAPGPDAGPFGGCDLAVSVPEE